MKKSFSTPARKAASVLVSALDPHHLGAGDILQHAAQETYHRSLDRSVLYGHHDRHHQYQVWLDPEQLELRHDRQLQDEGQEHDHEEK